MHCLKNVLISVVALAILTACGSDKKEPEIITAPERPDIEQAPANPVAFVPNSYDRPYTMAVASDAWYVADRSQGIIRIDQATQTTEVIAPYAANDEESLITSVAAMALSANEALLYVLDTRAKQIVAINLASRTQEQFITSDSFDVADNFAWVAPTSLVLDEEGNRLLVGDRFGYRAPTFSAFTIFSVNLADQTVSIIAESSVAESSLQSFEARDFTYDAAQGYFYVSGLSENLLQQSYYSAYRFSESDWSRKLLPIGASKIVSRSAAAHDIVYRANEGIYLIDSSGRALVNLDVDTEDAKARIIGLSNDDKDYPLARPVAIHFTQENQVTVLDEGLSALFSVNFSITVEQDGEGKEAGYTADSTRALLASGRPVYPEPTTAPQIVFDLHFHQASNRLIVTDRALSQADIYTYEQGVGYSAWQISPVLDGLAFTEEPYEVPLKEGQAVEDIVPDLPDTPKPIFVTTDSSGELIAYARGFLVEAEAPEIIDKADGTQAVVFSYRRYPPALWQIDTEAFTATAISIQEVADGDNAFVKVPFSSFDIIGMSANDKGIYFLPSNPYSQGIFVVYYWSKEQHAFFIAPIEVANDIRGAKPTNIAYDANTQTFLMADAINDAILTFDPEARALSTLSGRMNNGDLFLPLPAGIASDSANKAYSFENSLKALVEIDIATGNRTRLDSPINYIRSVGQLTLDSGNTPRVYLLEKLSQRIITIDLMTLEQQWLD